MANEPRRRMESGAADAHHMSMEGRLARPFAYPLRTGIDRLCLPSVWMHYR
jgi:hypothetical protein